MRYKNEFIQKYKSRQEKLTIIGLGYIGFFVIESSNNVGGNSFEFILLQGSKE